MARSNYQFHKRQKELERKKKKELKRQIKMDKKAALTEESEAETPGEVDNPDEPNPDKNE